MLDSLRKFGSSFIGKIVLGFLLIGLAGFGIQGVLTSIGSTTVASVGSEEISIREFQRAYNNQLNAVAGQIGSVPTAEQALQLGVPTTVINRLAADASLDSLSKRLGIGASDERLGDLLREDPNFAGVLGRFDRANFEQALQFSGYTEAEYLNTLRSSAGRQQVVLSTFGQITMPAAATELIGRYTNDTRTIEYFILDPDLALPPADPTDEEMAAFLADNQARFRTAPTRSVDVMVLTPEILAEGIEVSEDEIAAEYERTKAGLVRIETRDIEQVVLDAEQVAIFEAGLESGVTFEELVVEAGLLPTDLGSLTEAQISDAALAEAAFALEEGGFALVPGVAGTRAVHVSAIEPGGELSLEEARDDLESKLRLAQARDQFLDVLDQIEELRAAFRPLPEIAERFGLEVTPVDATAAGTALAEVDGIPADGASRVASAIFSTEMGDLAPSVALGANRNVWFDLKAIEPARDQTLDEVRDVISEEMLAERLDDSLHETAEASLNAIEGGQAIDEVAVGRNTFPEFSDAFNRTGLPGTPIDASVAQAVFSGPEGYSSYARNSAGQYVVFTVTGVNPAEEELPEQAYDYVAGQWRDNLYGGFVNGLREDAGLRINQTVLSQQIGLTGN